MQGRRFLGAIFLLFSLMVPAAHADEPYMLFDINDGKILLQNDAFSRWYPASLTKLMTTYVTFKALQKGEVTLLSPVRITKNASRQPPSKIGLKPGTVLTLDAALKLMLVKSANDIAMAVGENVGGSEEAFVERMNAEARRLGMTGTHFTNPNGLFDPENYTTAHDLAILVSALRREFPQYENYFRIEAVGLGKKVIPNINVLIGRFDGADGMKTGFICAGGFNFIGTATRNGKTLGAIVLGAFSLADRAEKAAALLHRGFGMDENSAMPTITSLQPYGPGQDQATDMSDAVCSKEARKERASELGENGKPVLKSAFIHKMDHDPQVIMVSLGGATGPGGLPPEPVFADVPIPTPRPDYVPPRKTTARTQSAAVQ
ncbi:MAG: D-alanyl-D-alanine carboxypeptidase [Rhizobiaceae bacterium]|jgi:D-alanyl-D-alanine carboxypeptidase|nr:MAG: D-alanyl-D-alanine carboxypeptidase [Rhizobiaceae bacterium]